MTRTAWPLWALVVYGGVIIGTTMGLAQGLASGEPLRGVIGGLTFAVVGAAVVGAGLVRTRRAAPPERWDQARRVLPLALLAGALAGGLVMGLLLWVFDQD